MNGHESSAEQPTGQAAARREDGAARLLPKVTFGLSAAVLAGVVAVSVPAAPAAASAAGQRVVTSLGLDAAINAIAGPAAAETGCCGIHEQIPGG